MKKLLLVVLIFSGCSTLLAQQIKYEVKRDDPNDVCTFIVNLDLMNLDFNMADVGSSSFGTGLWARVELFNRIGVEATLRKSYLYFGKLGSNDKRKGNTELALGGHLKFMEKNKNKHLKVTLSSSSHTSGGYRYTTEKYIMVPGTVAKSKELRGGVLMKNLSMEIDEFTKLDDVKNEEIVNYFGTGFYAGISSTSISNLFITTDSYGYKFNSALLRFYFDVIFMPVNTYNLSLSGENVSKDIKSNMEKNSPMGFRVGCELFQIEKRDWTGKRFGLSYDVQIGVKPHLGFFMETSLGLSIFKERM